jgi:hypothetical protein
VLDPGGIFVIECFVADLSRFDHGQRVQAQSVTEDSATTGISRHDKTQQRVDTQVVTFDSQGIHLRPVAIRYSWPAELDLMAERAGLRLTGRYADWDRPPFTFGQRPPHLRLPASLTALLAGSRHLGQVTAGPGWQPPPR